MKISQHFNLEEFVPQNVFQQWGTNSIWFIDPKIIVLAEFIRTFFNKPITINNWTSGGQYNYSGFRDPDCPVGAKMSQHRFGRAIDVKVTGMTPQAVYGAILANKQVFMKAGLTTMEAIADTPTWVHCDIRQTGKSDILIVHPL